jgi:hypothetical protein
LRRWVRGPAFVLSCAAAFVAVLAIASGGFGGIRSLWRPAPYARPERLASLAMTDLRGSSWGLPIRSVAVFQRESKLVAALAAHQSGWWETRVTTNFFDVLGVPALVGRTFEPGDENVEPRPAVLSYALWRRRFGGRGDVIGRQFPVDRQPVTIVGVMPESFWAVSLSIDVWTPMALPQPEERRARGWVGAIARLNPGATRQQLQKELTGLADKNKVRGFGPVLAVEPVETTAEAPIYGYGFGLLFAIVAGAALVTVRKLPLSSLASGRSKWRYWSFFVAKTVAVLVGLAALWIEANSALRLRVDNGVVRDLLGGVGISVAFFVGCGLAMCWSFYDQRRRCPVCLNRLSMPVTIGSWSSPLLEPVSTEMMCELGHGTLCLPETQSSASEPDRWTALDDSWRELFTRK